MDNIDSISIWFQEFEKRNECCDIIIGIYTDNEHPETRLYPHARYDGVSTLLSYLHELDLTDPAAHLPRIPSRSNPGLPRQILAYFIYLIITCTRPPSRMVKVRTNGWPGQAVKVEKARLAWRIFDEAHSKTILDNARGNMNSYILSKLIPHMDPIWINKDRKISVGIPVSLHKTLAVSQSPVNRASLIDIHIDESTTGEQIHQQIKNKLSRNTHFAIRIGSQLSQYVGAWFYDRVFPIRSNFQNSNLIYSNLGNWSAASESAVFFIPPVIFCCPVSAGIVTWGNKLSIGIQIHPHLRLDSVALEDMVDKWSASLIHSDDIHYRASSRTTTELNLKRM